MRIEVRGGIKMIFGRFARDMNGMHPECICLLTALLLLGCTSHKPTPAGNRLTELRDAYRSGASRLDINGDGVDDWFIERTGGVATRETIDVDGDGTPEIVFTAEADRQRLSVDSASPRFVLERTWVLSPSIETVTRSDQNKNGVFDRRVTTTPLAEDATQARWLVERDIDEDGTYTTEADSIAPLAMERQGNAAAGDSDCFDSSASYVAILFQSALEFEPCLAEVNPTYAALLLSNSLGECHCL